MNTQDATLLASQLAMARTNASLGASHVEEVRRVAAIDRSIKTAPLHLAKYHFDEAARLIDQALGKTPIPTAPSLDEMIEMAKSRDESGRASVPTSLVGSSDPLALSAQEPPEALECGDSAPLSDATNATEQPATATEEQPSKTH